MRDAGCDVVRKDDEGPIGVVVTMSCGSVEVAKGKEKKRRTEKKRESIERVSVRKLQR